MKSQITRNAQAPASVVTTGATEWPIPRIQLDMPSIRPQRQYVVQIHHRRYIPASITSGPVVKILSSGRPKKTAPQPRTRPKVKFIIIVETTTLFIRWYWRAPIFWEQNVRAHWENPFIDV